MHQPHGRTKILRQSEQAKRLGCSRWTVRRIGADDPTYPKTVQVSPGIEGVFEDELEAWLESRRVASAQAKPATPPKSKTANAEALRFEQATGFVWDDALPDRIGIIAATRLRIETPKDKLRLGIHTFWPPQLVAQYQEKA